MALTRLAIDGSRALARPRTGTEWYSLEMIRALAALHSRPSLSVYYRRGQDPTPLPDSVVLRPVPPPRLWTHVGLSLAMFRDEPDALFVPAHVIPALHPRVSVVTIHDLGYKIEPAAHPARSRRMLDLSTRWSVRVAGRVIAVSSRTRDDLAAYYRVPAEKIVVIHSGVNPQRFHPLNDADIDAALAALGVSRPYVLFLSTVQPRKNVLRIVEAFEGLDCDALSLVIAGHTGWLAGDTERRIADSPRRERILRLGHVDDAVVPALYAGAAAFLLPSLYEGFGMGVLEAMACGCPVVTSDRSSLPEVAGDAAILVDPTDTESIRQGIVSALQPDTRRKLLQRGFRRAAEFSWDRAAQATLATIQAAYDGR